MATGSLNPVITWSGAATLDLSGASANSDPLLLKSVDHVAIQLVVTGHGGGASGTLKLQASNDPGADHPARPTSTISGIASWVDVTGASVTLNANGASMINLANAGFRWVRCVWTRSVAGTGTLAVQASAKMRG